LGANEDLSNLTPIIIFLRLKHNTIVFSNAKGRQHGLTSLGTNMAMRTMPFMLTLSGL
jgi:hypothetical protein